MSTERQTDFGDYVLIEVGEPTVDSPTLWLSQTLEWKAGTAPANQQIVVQQAQDALAANRVYVALAAPSTAQNAAQIKALSRQVNALIRIALGRFDGTN